MPILLVDNHDSFTYNIVDLIRHKLNRSITVVPSSAVEVNDIARYESILFSPGPGVPDEQPPAMNKILQQYATSKPILGICLGMQAIGAYFGAQLYNIPKVVHGRQASISVKNDESLFQGLPASIKVGLYHSWAVDAQSLPEDLAPIAFSEEGLLMALKHTSYPVYGIQFHPESFLTIYGDIILNNFLENECISPSL